MLVPTKATYSINDDGYTLNIPYSEVSKTAFGILEGGRGRERRGAILPSIMRRTPAWRALRAFARNGLADLATHAKYAWNMGLGDEVFVGAVVIAALVVIFYRWKRKRLS